MPDITMCQDNECPMKNKCYRFTATPSKYGQSYFAETPREDYYCDYFYPIKSQSSEEKIYRLESDNG
jgi:hypothetical protein